MLGRLADVVELSDHERAFLENQVRRHKAARSLSDRCRMILLCAEGLASKEVAMRLGVHEHTVGKWHRRFVRDRIEGLTDEYCPGRPRTVSDTQIAEVIERTAQYHTQRRHPLVDPLNGCRDRPVAYDDPADMECLRVAATPQ